MELKTNNVIDIATYSCEKSGDGTSASNGNWDLVPEQSKIGITEHGDGILKILQNLDVDVSMKKKHNILIIQNVNVNEKNSIPQEPPRIVNFDGNERDLYNLVFDEVRKLGGIKYFLLKLCKYAVSFCDGNKALTARKLNLSRRTIDNYENTKRIS
uniref:Uncharacterized protein n=1 Tax=viral metagenome TaxID=1070528 RepID=A0A6M3IKD1_9ZZZZ